MTQAAIVSLRQEAARNREIALEDFLFALAPEGNLVDALKSNEVRQIIRLFFLNVPDDLTDREKTIILHALGLESLSDIENQINELKRQIQALEESGQSSQELRYFGWSSDKTIQTADLTNADSVDSNKGTIPALDSDFAFFWFAVPQANGFPNHVLVGSGQSQDDWIHFMQQLPEPVNNADGRPYIIGITFRPQTHAIAGTPITLSYTE